MMMRAAVGFGASIVVIWIVFVLWLAATMPAGAHDSWISDRQYRDPKSNEWCCSEHDCAPIAAEGVKVVPGGYFIVETGEVISESRALPSRDGQFWRCRYLGGPKTGQTRCFFRGEPGS